MDELDVVAMTVADIEITSSHRDGLLKPKSVARSEITTLNQAITIRPTGYKFFYAPDLAIRSEAFDLPDTRLGSDVRRSLAVMIGLGIDVRRTSLAHVVDRRAHRGGYWNFLKDMQDKPKNLIS